MRRFEEGEWVQNKDEKFCKYRIVLISNERIFYIGEKFFPLGDATVHIQNLLVEAFEERMEPAPKIWILFKS